MGKLSIAKRILVDQIYYPKPASFLLNSVPKCGTNLLKNIVFAIANTRLRNDLSWAFPIEDSLERLQYVKSKIPVDRTAVKGEGYTGHVPYTDEIERYVREQGLKQILLVRDPRDYSVSIHHYIMKDKTPRHAYFDLYNSFPDGDARLLAVIEGFGEGKSRFHTSESSITNIRLVFDSFKSWTDDQSTMLMKYEYLIHPDTNVVEQTIREIGAYLEVDISEKQAKKIRRTGSDPKKSHTFRKGGTGGWKEEYKEQHIAAFQKVVGHDLDWLGYDLNFE